MDSLKGKPLGEELILSGNMLRSEGDLFLCGMTPDELSTGLGVPISFTDSDGGDFLLRVMGIE